MTESSPRNSSPCAESSAPFVCTGPARHHQERNRHVPPTEQPSSARVNPQLHAQSAPRSIRSAAGVIAVGTLVASPAEAKIVYTPTNTEVQYGTTIDLNNDGTADFAFDEFIMYHSQRLTIQPAVAGNAIRFNGAGAACGFFGVPVGPGEAFGTNTSYFKNGVFVAGFFQYSHTSFHGPFANAVNRYLGFKFLINGQVHFGWARLTIQNDVNNAVMTGYAYETEPNVNIIEGHLSGGTAESVARSDLLAPAQRPAILGLLARGGDGLALWRRKDRVSNAVGPRENDQTTKSREHQMTKKSKQSRPTAAINSKLNKSLTAYVAAASAAGATMLGPSAEAKIVYTPTNVNLTESTPIDLNHDGIADFTFQFWARGFHSVYLDVMPAANGNAVRGVGNSSAACGFLGVPVGPGEKFDTNSYYGHGLRMAAFSSNGTNTLSIGPWANVTNRYLGFKFLIKRADTLWLGAPIGFKTRPERLAHRICVRDHTQHQHH